MQYPTSIEDTTLETNRAGYYEVRWGDRDADGRYRSRSYSCRTKDRDIAEEVRRALISSAAQVTTGAHQKRLDQLIDRYIEHHVELDGITDAQRWSLKPIRAALGARFVSDVDTTQIVAYRRGREKAGRAGGTIRRELGALRAVLNWGIKTGELAKDTVLPHFPLPPASQARQEYLDPLEEQRMWDLAEALALDHSIPFEHRRIGMFVCIALETAGRSRAIETLTWDRVDLSAKLIDFREPGRKIVKKRRVAVPVSDRLFPVLFQWQANLGAANRFNPTGPVLMTTASTLKAFVRFRDRNKFDITRHGLRHTWATLKLQKGVKIWKVAGVLGDSVAVVQDTYGHHCPENLRDAVNA